MSDDTQLNETLAAIDAADDADALEAIRVAALGKKGWVSALLKTLGGMSPEERQVEGPKIQGTRAAVADAISAKKQALDDAELEARLASERLDLTLPATKPVVLVGAMRPADAVGYDGMRNFANAVRVAGDPDAAGRGGLVGMAERPTQRSWIVPMAFV